MSTAAGRERNCAYSEAVADLKAAHPEDWTDFYAKRLKARGLRFVKRLTPEERADKERVEAKAKAVLKIQALARENGLGVEVTG